MTDDIVKELRQYKQVKCWTCSEWGCYDDDGKHHWEEDKCVCDCHVSPVAAAADEIERLRMLGDRLVNAVYFLLDGAEPPEDLAGVLAVWEGVNHD